MAIPCRTDGDTQCLTVTVKQLFDLRRYNRNQKVHNVCCRVVCGVFEGVQKLFLLVSQAVYFFLSFVFGTMIFVAGGRGSLFVVTLSNAGFGFGISVLPELPLEELSDEEFSWLVDIITSSYGINYSATNYDKYQKAQNG